MVDLVLDQYMYKPTHIATKQASKQAKQKKFDLVQLKRELSWLDGGKIKVFINNDKSGLAGAWFIITIVSDCFDFRFERKVIIQPNRNTNIERKFGSERMHKEKVIMKGLFTLSFKLHTGRTSTLFLP